MHRISFFTLLAICLLASSLHAASVKNGFIIDEPLIPEAEILSGGVPRDGIPALTLPKFVGAGHAEFLSPRDRVLGLHMNGIARAYPLKILNSHEIINDVVGEPVVVTYCPLCGTGIAFSGTIDGKVATFGVSGLLYNSDVLMYDHQTESLWAQIASRAVSGAAKGRALERIALTHTSWEDWRLRHPDTDVLSIDTGHQRDYYHDPYNAYLQSDKTMFPVANRDGRLPPKALVLGLEIDGEFKAYPLSQLPSGSRAIADVLAGVEIVIHYDLDSRSGRVLDSYGQEIPTFLAFWFAWSAFHPQTGLYTR